MAEKVGEDFLAIAEGDLLQQSQLAFSTVEGEEQGCLLVPPDGELQTAGDATRPRTPLSVTQYATQDIFKAYEIESNAIRQHILKEITQQSTEQSLRKISIELIRDRSAPQLFLPVLYPASPPNQRDNHE